MLKSPRIFVEVVAKNVTWGYLAGADPVDDWKDVGAELSDWKSGKAGFGYGYGNGDYKTELKDMEDNYASVYLRREFDLARLEELAGLGLALRWDDGFIDHLNGEEILRENIRRGEGTEATGIASVDATGEHVGFPLRVFELPGPRIGVEESAYALVGGRTVGERNKNGPGA